MPHAPDTNRNPSFKAQRRLHSTHCDSGTLECFAPVGRLPPAAKRAENFGIDHSVAFPQNANQRIASRWPTSVMSQRSHMPALSARSVLDGPVRIYTEVCCSHRNIPTLAPNYEAAGPMQIEFEASQSPHLPPRINAAAAKVQSNQEDLMKEMQLTAAGTKFTGPRANECRNM